MKIDRLISVIMILLERQRVSIPELAEICEVSARTISRDIDTINLAGIPVISYPGLNGGVGILDTYKIEKRIFSTADITTLLMGLGCIRSSLSGEEVANAVAKIKGFIPEGMRKDIELKAGRLTIDLSPWVGEQKAETIEIIQKAMDGNRVLEFSYNDRMGQKSSRTVEPYRLVLKGMRWYLDAYCLTRADFRLFKLSRMSFLTLGNGQFLPREYNPMPIVQPEFCDKGVTPVKVLISNAAKERFLDIYGDECVKTSTADGVVAEIFLPQGTLGYTMLLRFGADIKCLEPNSYRNEFVAYIHKIIDLNTD